MVKRKIPSYDKNYDVFKDIHHMIKTTITNAKELEYFHTRNGVKVHSIFANPSSQIYKIIEKLICS